jgi:large subunit ribosomal protein L9
MIQPVEEIKSLGKFKVKVSLHSEVDAEITVNVSSADTISNYTFFSPTFNINSI